MAGKWYISLTLLLLVECLTCAIIKINLEIKLAKVRLEGTKHYVESLPLLVFVSIVFDFVPIYYEFFGGRIGVIRCTIVNRLVRLAGIVFHTVFQSKPPNFSELVQVLFRFQIL